MCRTCLIVDVFMNCKIIINFLLLFKLKIYTNDTLSNTEI